MVVGQVKEIYVFDFGVNCLFNVCAAQWLISLLIRNNSTKKWLICCFTDRPIYPRIIT